MRSPRSRAARRPRTARPGGPRGCRGGGTRRRRPGRAHARRPRRAGGGPGSRRDPRRTPRRHRPRRVTRAISVIPATGSFMKWTTSCARTASNASSGNGSRSAGACRTSTPGWRARVAATNGSDGSTAATAVGSQPRDQLARERAGAAADVENPLPAAYRGEVRQLAGQQARVPTHEAVVGLGGDIEAHVPDSTLSRRPLASPLWWPAGRMMPAARPADGRGGRHRWPSCVRSRGRSRGR